MAGYPRLEVRSQFWVGNAERVRREQRPRLLAWVGLERVLILGEGGFERLELFGPQQGEQRGRVGSTQRAAEGVVAGLAREGHAFGKRYVRGAPELELRASLGHAARRRPRRFVGEEITT